MNKSIPSPLFEKEVLKLLPLHYRFMVGTPTDFVEELRVGARYSRSNRHRSTKYLNYGGHKPNSVLHFVQEIVNAYDDDEEE